MNQFGIEVWILRDKKMEPSKKGFKDVSEPPRKGLFKMRLKMLKYFSVLLVMSFITFTAVVFVPNVRIVNLADYEEMFVENVTVVSVERPSKVSLDSVSFCDKLREYHGLNEVVGVDQHQEQLFIVIAYRDREEHKKVFMEEMTKYLGKKNLNFRIILVEQDGKDPFNRAKLMNIGALEALKESLKLDSNKNLDSYAEDIGDLATCFNPQVCFVFHDIDMIPENPDIPYNCTLSPILLATAVEQFKYKLPYPDYFGGVTAISLNHFLSINGYPNRYWGWGGEDDDVYERCKYRKLNPKQLDLKIGRFKSQSHQKRSKEEEFGGRFKELKKVRRQLSRDGFRQVAFRTLNSSEETYYKHVLVDLLYVSANKTVNYSKLPENLKNQV